MADEVKGVKTKIASDDIEMVPYKEKCAKPRTGHDKAWQKRKAKEKARRKANKKNRK